MKRKKLGQRRARKKKKREKSKAWRLCQITPNLIDIARLYIIVYIKAKRCETEPENEQA